MGGPLKIIRFNRERAEMDALRNGYAAGVNVIGAGAVENQRHIIRRLPDCADPDYERYYSFTVLQLYGITVKTSNRETVKP